MSEAGEAKRIGATLTKNSGRGQHNKGDCILDGVFTIDIKEYEKSFGLSQTVWAKICSDANANRTEPALKIVLGNRARMMVISETMFLELYDAWKRQYGDITSS